MTESPFKGVERKRPTKRHRPALWECMLGTLYARNDAGEVRYFDYDWDAAREFAGVADNRDLRLARWPHRTSGEMSPRKGQLVLYVGPTPTA